jgi:hypothetical protein
MIDQKGEYNGFTGRYVVGRKLSETRGSKTCSGKWYRVFRIGGGELKTL